MHIIAGNARQAVPAELLTERRGILRLGEAEHHDVDIIPACPERPRPHREGLRKRVHNIVVFMAPYVVGP